MRPISCMLILFLSPGSMKSKVSGVMPCIPYIPESVEWESSCFTQCRVTFEHIFLVTMLDCHHSITEIKHLCCCTFTLHIPFAVL